MLLICTNIYKMITDLLDIFPTRKTTHLDLYLTNFNKTIKRIIRLELLMGYFQLPFHFSLLKRAIGCLIIVLIQACSTLPENESWPTDLPARQIFIENCKNNSNSCSTRDKTEEYLIWVKRFYYGSVLYPSGWNEMTELLTSSLQNSGDKTIVRDRLDKLGLVIVFEWAKENSERLINSQLLATWGSALRSSAERNEQIEFITRIDNDVNSILSGSLMPEEIIFERYYPTEDYDNF